MVKNLHEKSAVGNRMIGKVCLIHICVACCLLSLHLVMFGCTVEFELVKPICGDGKAEGEEECDGEDLRGETCESKGFVGGTLGCT